MGAIGKFFRKSAGAIGPKALLFPSELGPAYLFGEASKAVHPELTEPDMQPLPDVKGPQDVPLREQNLGQLLSAQGTQATGGEDLPGTSLFSPKRKAASRALIGY